MKATNNIRFVKERNVKCFGVVNFTKLVAKVEQASSEMKLEQLELGGRAPPRKKSFIEKDRRISALFERFKEGQYSLSDFLDAIMIGLSLGTWIIDTSMITASSFLVEVEIGL